MEARRLQSFIETLARDLSALKDDVNRMKIRPVMRDGRDGRDGITPDQEAITKDVLREVQDQKAGRDGEPGKDGVSPDKASIIRSVLAAIPKPKDGVTPDKKEIAAQVFEMVPEAVHGTNGSKGEPGEKGEPGKDGAPGKDGSTITNVKLDEQNRLFIWIDGVKKLAGTLKIPKSIGPFTPGGGAGLSAKGKGGPATSIRFITIGTAQLETDTAIFSTGTHDFTLLDHLTAKNPIDIKCDGGTLSLIGTTDTPILTPAEAVRLYPTPTGWRYNG